MNRKQFLEKICFAPILLLPRKLRQDKKLQTYNEKIKVRSCFVWYYNNDSNQVKKDTISEISYYDTNDKTANKTLLENAIKFLKDDAEEKGIKHYLIEVTNCGEIIEEKIISRLNPIKLKDFGNG
jgi:hypothetical protein